MRRDVGSKGRTLHGTEEMQVTVKDPVLAIRYVLPNAGRSPVFVDGGGGGASFVI